MLRPFQTVHYSGHALLYYSLCYIATLYHSSSGPSAPEVYCRRPRVNAALGKSHPRPCMLKIIVAAASDQGIFFQRPNSVL